MTPPMLNLRLRASKENAILVVDALNDAAEQSPDPKSRDALYRFADRIHAQIVKQYPARTETNK